MRLSRRFLPPVVAALCALAAPAVLRAPPARLAPTPTPSPTSAQPPAHVRLWKTDLRAFTGLRVAFTPEGRHANAHDLPGSGAGYQFNEYGELPAGRGTFDVFSDKDKQHPLDALPVNLKTGAFATVLLSEPEKEGEPPRIELIDDGITDDASPAQITVRNFAPGLKNVRVSIGDELKAQFASDDAGFLVMRGIKPAFYQVHTAGTSVEGTAFEWMDESDLRQYRRQTLLIYPDAYGRIRPRVYIDGRITTAPPPNADGQR